MIDKHLKINHLFYHIAATEGLIFEVETFITGDAASEHSRIGHWTLNQEPRTMQNLIRLAALLLFASSATFAQEGASGGNPVVAPTTP